MKLLHLEDSPHDAVLIEELLSHSWPDLVIERVASGSEYKRALEQENFDLILSDYSLPGFDGLSALELANKVCPKTPFIFISGTIGEDRAIDALKRGAADYIIKDRPSRLVRAIQQALAHVEEEQRRVATAEALRESQERFRQLAEQSSDVFWFLSVNPENMLYVSPAIERLWGVPADRFYEDTRLRLKSIHADDQSRVVAAFESWLNGRAPRFDEEYRVVRPDGTLSWILDSGTTIRSETGEIIRLSGIAKDITERHLAEEGLREQASLLDKARDAIVATDLEQRVAYWNASAERLYGWTAAEAFGRRLEQLDLGYDSERFAAARFQLLTLGEWRGNFRLKAKNGDALQVESTWSLVLGSDGLPRSILHIDTDVTDRKKLETRLLQADRMDSIGMLAGGVAHDLNNVLAPILMGTELLRMRDNSVSDLHVLENMERSAQHGVSLVRQLLTFARGEEGERGQIEVAPLIVEVHKLLRQSLPNNIQLSIDCAKDLSPIQADSTQIKQLLLNLGINARDAMPTGGQIQIQAENRTVDETLALLHPGAQTGPHVVISVTDSGTGIPPAVLEKIFDPFFTTKAIGKGTGLGLSTALGIVKSHGGFLNVESEVGQGTTFHLYFPFAAQAFSAPPTSATP